MLNMLKVFLLGEFFEALFVNVRGLTTRFEVEKKDLENIQKAILPAIDYAQNNIPFTTNEQKARFYDLLLNARCAVTEVQIAYYREKPKKPTMPISFPPFPTPTIQLETEEE